MTQTSTATQTTEATNVTVGLGTAVHALRLATKDGGRLHHDNVRCGAGRSSGGGFINAATIKLTNHAVTCKRCIRITESDAIWAGNATPKETEATQPITADRITELTAARDAQLATANEPNLPLIRERALRQAENLTAQIAQIAELAGAAVCGMCQLHLATETVTVPNVGEERACLTCAAMVRAFL